MEGRRMWAVDFLRLAVHLPAYIPRYKTESWDLKKFNRQHHMRPLSNTAPMVVEAKYVHKDEPMAPSSYEDDHYSDVEAHTGYELCTCPVCKGVTLRSYFWYDAMDPEDVS